MEKEEMLELLFNEKNQLQTLLKCNEYTKKFGLTLSNEDAKVLMNDTKETLVNEQRFEFGEGILAKLIFEFCDSAYISQDNYVATIGKLQEIFYMYKNESLDEVTDDELLQMMKESFEGECQGSLEFLEETILDQFAREVRKDASWLGKNFIRYRERNDDYYMEDEDE